MLSYVVILVLVFEWKIVDRRINHFTVQGSAKKAAVFVAVSLMHLAIENFILAEHFVR